MQLLAIHLEINIKFILSIRKMIIGLDLGEFHHSCWNLQIGLDKLWDIPKYKLIINAIFGWDLRIPKELGFWLAQRVKFQGIAFSLK